MNFPQYQKKSQTSFIKDCEIYNLKDIKKAHSKIISKLEKLLDDIKNQTSLYSIDGKLVRIKPIDTVKALSMLETESDTELVVRNIILNSALTADKRHIGSAYIFLNFLVYGLPKKNHDWFFRATKANCLKIVDCYNGNSITTKIVKKIIDISGPNSKVFFNNSSDHNFNIRAFRGKVLSASKHEIFSHRISKMKDARVLFIDGIIESIGELEGLLQDASKDKTPILMISSGWSPDIVSTLDKNYELGNLNIVPAVIKNIDSEQLENFCLENSFDIFTPRVNSDIRSLKVSDLKYCSDVIFGNNTVMISTEKGVYSTEVKIPARFSKVGNFIKDKILLSYYMASSAAKLGVADFKIEEGNVSIFSPAPCVKESIDAVKSTQELIFNLHRVIKT